MSEAPSGLEALFGGGLFAVSFEEADTPALERGRQLVSILDKDGRSEWFYQNMNKYLKGRMNGVWFNISKKSTNDIDSSLDDLRRKRTLTPEDSTKIAELRQNTVSAIAVSASARAMEQSAGASKSYLALLCGVNDPKGADAGIQDTLDEILLHDHPEKYDDVMKIDGVKGYFNQMLQDAGITNFEAWNGKTQSKFEFHPDVFKNIVDGNLLLVESFSKSGQRFEKYITHKIENVTATPPAAGEVPQPTDFTKEFVKARLAADIFLTDVFTRWQYSLMIQAENMSAAELTARVTTKEALYKKVSTMKPFENWGGDPLVPLLEPSILPRRFKGVYSEGEGKMVLDMIDAAFRPADAFAQVADTKVNMLPVSMAVNLKAYDRFSDALWGLLGASTALAVPNFEAKTGEALNSMANLLFQVYGGAKTTDGQPVGKEIVGLMVSRVVELKSRAAVLTTSDPSLSKAFNIIFESEGKGPSPRPFLEVRKMLWGEDLDGRSGVLKALSTDQFGLRFNSKTNRFNSSEALKSAWDLLSTNSADEKKRELMRNAQKWSIIFDVIESVNEAYFKGRS